MYLQQVGMRLMLDRILVEGEYVCMFARVNQNAQQDHNAIAVNRQMNIIPKHYVTQPGGRK
jgi:hypothetical protein